MMCFEDLHFSSSVVHFAEAEGPCGASMCAAASTANALRACLRGQKLWRSVDARASQQESDKIDQSPASATACAWHERTGAEQVLKRSESEQRNLSS